MFFVTLIELQTNPILKKLNYRFFEIPAFENWLCFSEHTNPSGKKAAFQR